MLKFLGVVLPLVACVISTTGCDAGSQSDDTGPGFIGQGTLASDDAVGSRSKRFDFRSLATALHTITVSWDSSADVQFNILDSTGSRINGEAVQGSNPGVWVGELVAGARYSLFVWSAEDGTDFITNVEASVELAIIEPDPSNRYLDDADRFAWILEGPAPTLDYDVGNDTNGWGSALLRVGDVLLVGGDFRGIRAGGGGPDLSTRPWLAALDAMTGQPVPTFEPPEQIDDVVRSLALSTDGTTVYAGGDFGLVALNAATGDVDFEVPVIGEGNSGRVFKVLATEDQLYIGGDFSQVGNAARSHLARVSLLGELDTAWNPSIAGGISRGRSAPVQSLALSPSGDVLYVGGTYSSMNGTPVATTELGTTVSMLAISTVDGSVGAERFSPELVLGEEDDSRDLVVHDIAAFDAYIAIAWGGPNYFTLHQADGARLQQYSGTGDVQAIHVLGDLVFVGHHGEFLGTLTDPIPPEAVASINPLSVEPFKLHAFRMDSASARLIPEQAWPINGTFGVWAIHATEDSLWIAGDVRRAGANRWDVEGLARFSAL